MTKKAYTRARRGDPETSFVAARQFLPKLRETQQKVYSFLRDHGPKCAYDIEEHFGDHGSSYRTRISELKELGLVVDSGVKVERKGRRRIVWKAIAPQDTEIARHPAVQKVFKSFPGAQIVSVSDAPLQDSQKGLDEAPSPDTPTPKLPEFLRRAKRPASS